MNKKVVFSLSLLLIVVTLSAAFFSCHETEPKRETSEYVSFNLPLNEDGTFKILQLTDLHFIASELQGRYVYDNLTLRDEWAATSIAAIVEEADPDLIVVTGDAVFTVELVKDFTGTCDNYEAFKKAAECIDSFGIPWLFLFGNHDEEGDLQISLGSAEAAKKMLGKYLKSDKLKNCLYDSGPEEINGEGNYIVNVLNKDGSVNTSLVLFDSGSYLKYVDERTGELYADQRAYEYVHDDQLDWYEAAIRDITRIEGHLVPSIIFQHIPMPVYQSVIDSFIDALEAQGTPWQDTINVEWEYGRELTLNTEIGEITYHGGICEEPDHEVCCSYVGDFGDKTYTGGDEFRRIKELGSSKYVFCGHDHRNTFSFTYEGIRLSYGMSIDYSANGIIPPPFAHNQTIYDDVNQRGGTLITLAADSSVAVSQIPFTRNLYRETLVERSAKR